MSESIEDRLKRLRKRRNVARLALKGARRAAARYKKLVRLLNRRIARLKQPDDVPPMNPGGWHPDAIKNQVHGGIGDYLNVPAKLCWHTTESSGLPTYSGSHPHFTLDFKRGKLYQHIAVTSGAMALRNLSLGVETNRANAIQVELVGFSDAAFAARVGKASYAVGQWTDSDYAQIAALARWIEKHCDVKRQCSVTFTNASHPLPGQTWLNYAGHLGHQHVPENTHWDPSAAFKISKVI